MKITQEDLEKMTEEERCQLLIDSLESWANDIDTIEGFKFGTATCEDGLIDLGFALLSSTSYFIKNKKMAEMYKIGHIFRGCLKRIDFSPVTNDKFMLKWIIKNKICRRDVKRIDRSLRKKLLQAIQESNHISVYIFSMILIHRHALPEDIFDKLFNYFYYSYNHLTPTIPISVLESNCKWAEGKRDLYQVKMELNNSPREIINEAF